MSVRNTEVAFSKRREEEKMNAEYASTQAEI